MGAIAGAAVLAAMAIAGCSKASAGTSSISATAAYVPVPAGQATVGYLAIRNNGTVADRLVSVTTSVGGTVQLRGPERPGAPVIMHTVSAIQIPAGTMVQLVPNSYHLLITGAGPMHDGKDITLNLKFAHAGTITILALVTNPNNGGGSYFLN